ncbi:MULTISPECIES: BRO-N domain-containing protein [Pseudomonas]|uniref:BRO-N domain-containing protein n=1 Tax=Pseudomonas TaxID=286 RepID=UPI0009E517D6|nr:MULTISPECIES: BRO family protein [Pseudomonas]MDI4197853.1 BRO family protein [Pseudomonas aeruginosa]WEO39488.1 BRO family protein [Pseudomonas aeruginosa]
MSKHELTNFFFHNGSAEAKAIRVVTLNGEPWFHATDVCNALEIKHTPTAVSRIAAERKCCLNLHLPGRAPTFVSEAGLYDLILQSRKPEAREFKDWITGTVLPAIRKDGAYIMGEEKVATGEMDEDAFVLKAIEIRQRKIDRLKAENDAMSQELNVLTVDESRALTHRYFTHSQKVKLGQAAARILRAQGQEPQRQERTVRFHGEERIVRVNLYPRAALEQAERELAA